MVDSVAPHGLHHVTAIAEDPQRNVDFYTTVLGLRLVKRTVNFDAPDTYHLYYGDASGRPSTLLTFFPWPGAQAGKQGTGLTTATAFSVPPESLGWWQQRLQTLGVDADAPVATSDEEVLRLRDPDGLVIELIASEGDSRSGWDGVAAIPLSGGGEVAGVLTLYGTLGVAAPAAVQRAGLFADAATALLREHYAVAELRQQEAQLRDALTSRAVIDQAKGILMARRGIDAEAAFAELVAQSHSAHVKVREVARRLVADASAVRTPAHGSDATA